MPNGEDPTEGLSPEELAVVAAFMNALSQKQAEEDEFSRAALRDLLGGMGIDVPFTMEEIEEAAANLLQAESFGRMAEAFGLDVDMGPVQEMIEGTRATLLERASDRFGPEGGAVSQAISEYITSTVERQELAAREEVLTRREYLDIPTPEEFLDNFNTALATHTQALFEAGELDRDTMQWIRDNPDILFDEYIADMGKRAAEGEEIFKPVGVEGAGEPELVGERPGRQEVRDVQTQRGALTETLTQAQQAAQVTQGGVTAPRTTARTTQEQQQLTERERLGATFAETEQIFTRPRLDFVYAVSPLDWLKERGTGTEITFGAEREKGRRKAEQRQITGIPQPRRVV